MMSGNHTRRVSLVSTFALVIALLPSVLAIAEEPPLDIGFHASITSDMMIVYRGSGPGMAMTYEIFDSGGASLFGPQLRTTDADNSFFVDGSEHGVDLIPGMRIVVTDVASGVWDDLVLEAVSFDGVDWANDTVWGTAEAGRALNVRHQATTSNDTLEVTADGSGNWSADFGAAGIDLNADTFNLHVIMHEVGGNDGTIADWQELPLDIGFHASIDSDMIVVFRGSGPAMTMTYQIYAASGSSLFGPALSATDEGNTLFVDGSEHGVDLIPGMRIVVTDVASGTWSDLLLEPVTIDDVDRAANTVSGTSPPGRSLDVRLISPSSDDTVSVTSDPLGDWNADVGSAGVDITADTGIHVILHGVGGGNGTIADWQEPPPPPPPLPTFRVGQRGMHGWGFEPMNPLTITFSGGGGAWVTATTADETGFFFKEFESADWHLLPGHVVTVDDGTTVKSHTVTALAVTAVDPDSDTLSGVADPGSPVTAAGGDGNPPWRTVPVDASGTWSADLGAPCTPGDEGCEGEPADIVLDALTLALQGDHWGCRANGGTEETCPPLPAGLSGGEAFQCDEDGDCTLAQWPIGESIRAYLDSNSIWGGQWSEGAEVTVEVDAGDDGSVDYVETAVAEVFGGEVGAAFSFQESGLRLSPGDRIVMYDGRTTKELVVHDLTITWVDAHLDQVFGTAPPDAEFAVHTWSCEDDICEGGWRIAVADQSGDWVADFSTPFLDKDPVDIRPGSEVGAQLADDDLDYTHVSAHATDPRFGVDPDTDVIWGDEWMPANDVLVEVDSDADPGNGVLYSATVATDAGGHFESRLSGILDIQAHHQVRVSWKAHDVTEVVVTSVDSALDTVSGTAAPGSAVLVQVRDELQIWQHITFQFGPGRLVANAESLNEHLKFRQAVAHAIDREALVAGVPGGGDAIDSYVDAYLPELSQHGWAQYDYDPARAAQLLGELCSELSRDCVANPPVAVFGWHPSFWRIALADLLKPMFEAVGIGVVIDLDPDFWTDGFALGEFDVGEWAWAAEPTLADLVRAHDRWDPTEAFESNPYQWGTTGSSVIDDNTARMAELVGLMHSTSDDAELIAYVQEAELILSDQAMFIPLYSQPWAINGPYRLVTVDAAGDWTADFSAPWEDQDAYDISVGSHGFVEQSDDDGDFTHREWQVFGVTAVSSVVDPIPVGTTVDAIASLVNPLGLGVDASWDWGDGTVTSGVIDGDEVSGTHSYDSPGVYEVRIDAADTLGNSASGFYRYVVAYDPSAGFATGGGWLIPGGKSSDPGDLLPGLDGTSKANFGFVVKYATGASTLPGGNLEFHYNVGSFHLHSTGMEWLVVTNSNWAKFQGMARIDGTSDLYPFRVDARDSDTLGDRFIIKVWAPGTDPDLADPIYKASGDLGGGQITIHR